MRIIMIAFMLVFWLAAPSLADNGFKEGAREIGQGFKEGSKKVGEGFKELFDKNLLFVPFRYTCSSLTHLPRFLDRTTASLQKGLIFFARKVTFYQTDRGIVLSPERRLSCCHDNCLPE